MRDELPEGFVDVEVARLATRQHGVVARAQLVALGLSKGAIGRRVSSGRLHPLHRGAYAVGHRAVSRHGWWLAAVLACGDGALLSHRSAAALWGLRPTDRSRVEVTVSRRLRGRRDIEVRELPLARDESATWDGVPVTSVPRTLMDLAAILTRPQLQRTAEQAEALRLTDPLTLDALLARYPGRPGIRNLRAVAKAGIQPTVTRSELERRFLEMLERADLPRPRVNAPIELADGWIEVDCAWPDRRVIVELDGHAHHATRAAFERDRARDRALQAAGWRVVRVTWRQLHQDAAAVAADLARLLL
jgi:very-short-patch-repair endonuclease